MWSVYIGEKLLKSGLKKEDTILFLDWLFYVKQCGNCFAKNKNGQILNPASSPMLDKLVSEFLFM